MEEVIAAAVIFSGIGFHNPWLFFGGILLLVILLIIAGFAATKILLHVPHPRLARSDKNPILGPNKHNAWESEAVFNPAVVYEGGRIHLLYRALGEDGVSRIGYASSKDGVHFDERLPYPVFVPHNMTEEQRFHNPFTSPARLEYDPALWGSGGGWGGSEDPRAISINGRIFMTYCSFDGWDSIRMAMTSIDTDHFLHKSWKWDRPVFLSPPKSVNKNWVLFPEKIGGRYAVLHSISPDILIEYVDDFSRFRQGRFIHSHYSRLNPARRGFWDNWVRGAGPPPLKTPDGWLVFYHAIDKREAHRYKIGAMLLSLNDPTKVLYRSSQPILEPDMPYENDWKPGIVYASGAIIKDGTLFLYYGGGDKTINVATAPISRFLGELKRGVHIVMETKPALAQTA